MLLAIHLTFLAESAVIEEDEFWVMLQSGLVHNDPLTRKRALFCVKCLVDFVNKVWETPDSRNLKYLTWSLKRKDDYWNIWKSVIIVFETLEEKQVSSF